MTEVPKILNTTKRIDPTLFDVDEHNFFIFVIENNKYILKDSDQLISKEFKPYIHSVIIIDKDYLSIKKTRELDLEIRAYLDSLSGTSYERALKAYNAVATLRLGNNKVQPLINTVVCNTLRGKVHYHDLFGNGAIDYARVMSALIDSGYDNYCTIELYNHASLWKTVAPQSIKYILAAMTCHFGWNLNEFGHIDHTKVVVPYIRVADANLCPNGTLSILYDFRLCQPNTSSLSSTILHSLEHCLLAILPGLLPGFLMVGPMGCRTGMYIVTSIPVALDILYSCFISYLRGFLKERDLGRIVTLYQNLNIPTWSDYLNSKYLWSSVNERIMHRNGKQLIPIPVGIGRCKFINDLSQKEIQPAIDLLKEISLSFVS